MLPVEIIFEILILLSVKTLLRLKSVCKGWRVLIDDPLFIKEHLHRSECCSIDYVDSDMALPRGPSSSWLHDIYFVICEVHGLSLQCHLVSSKYSIKNPATRQILHLPDPQKNSLAMAFTHVKSTDEYKVVSLYSNLDGALGHKCELLAISDNGDLAWKQLEMPDLNETDIIRTEVVPVTTVKAVHFVRLVSTTHFHYVQVDSLDLATDTFTTSVLPLARFRKSPVLRPFNAGGRLAIGATDARTKTLHIMKLKDHRKSQWANSMIVYPLRFLESREVKSAVPLLIRKRTLALWISGQKLIWYDTTTKTVSSTIGAPEGMLISQRIVLNSSTLVSLKGMRPDTNNSAGES